MTLAERLQHKADMLNRAVGERGVYTVVGSRIRYSSNYIPLPITNNTKKELNINNPDRV